MGTKIGKDISVSCLAVDSCEPAVGRYPPNLGVDVWIQLAPIRFPSPPGHVSCTNALCAEFKIYVCG